MGLSDGKRKQRLVGSAASRNAAWSNNEALPGQRLLASMGWQAGQGLGTSQQGMSAPVTMAFKLDNKGIGARRFEREARASGKVDAWIGGGGDLGSLFERLNKAAATSADLTEEAASNEDVSNDTSDLGESGSSKREKKEEKKRKREKADDKEKRRAEKRKAKEEKKEGVKDKSKDKKDKGKGKEKEREDTVPVAVKPLPIRQAHRARFLRAKRLVNGSDAVSLNEILGIASPSSGSPAPSPAPLAIASTSISPEPSAPGGEKLQAEDAASESKEERKKRRKEEKSREKEKRKRKNEEVEEDDDDTDKKGRKEKKKKDKDCSLLKDDDKADAKPRSSDPSFEAGSGNIVSTLSVQEYLQGRLMQRRAALIRRQRSEQEALWQRAATVVA